MSKTQQEIAAPESINEHSLGLRSEQQKEKVSKNRYFTTKRVTQLAALIALALVMKLIGKVLTLTPSFTVTLIYIPWMLSGIILGPLSGIIVGAFSDILGNLIYVGLNGFNPITLLSNSLYALPVALLYKIRIKNDYIKSVLGGIISLFVCTLGIGSFAIYWSKYLVGGMLPINYFVFMVTERLAQSAVVAVNIVLLCLMIKPLQRVGIFPVYSADKQDKYSSGKAAFWVSFAVLTIASLSAIIAAAVTGRGSPLTYVILSAVYLIVLSIISVLVTKKNADSRLFIGFASLAMSLLCLGSAAVIFISNYNYYTFAPGGWLYLFMAVPLYAFSLGVYGLEKRSGQVSTKAAMVNKTGVALSLATMAVLLIAITYSVIAVI